MLNAKYVRDNLEAIRESLKRRKSDYPLDDILELDKMVREIKTKMQALQAQRNKASLEIADLKRKGEKADSKIAQLGKVKGDIEKYEKDVASSEQKIDGLLWNMPNVLDPKVPYGKGEEDNKEIRKWGEPAKGKGIGHEEILNGLGLIDLEQAAKVSGARFYYLKGDLALLEQSLIRFAIDEMIKKKFTLIAPPLLLKREYYRGATALGDFEDALYRAADTREAGKKEDYEGIDEETFFISTSEHPLAALHAGQTFTGKELPKRYIGVSPCFRREAGAHGRDTKGIFRVHHFYKVEQFIFCKPEDSPKYFDELQANAEALCQKLKLPYHVLEFCTGGIGTVAARKNDVEVYMKGQGKYRELTSCSNCTDWQSVRLDIKYDEKGERRYVHTLNSTALPTTRTLVAIVENYYNEADNSITIPDVLVPYMGKSKIGKA